RGSLEAAEPRDSHAARNADPPEVIPEDVDDHHVLGTVLLRGEELAREPAVVLAVAAAGARALDRVGRDLATRRDGHERLRRRGGKGAPGAGQGVRAEVEV